MATPPLNDDPGTAAVLHATGQLWEAARGVLVAYAVHADTATDAARVEAAALLPWEQVPAFYQGLFGMGVMDALDDIVDAVGAVSAAVVKGSKS